MKITCNTTVYETDGEQTLLEVLQNNGAHISAHCGGRKTCRKCRVYLTEGSVKTSEAITFAPNEVLACDAYPLEDCSVAVFSEEIFTEMSETPSELSPFSENIGVAVDVGTTTIAVEFYDLTEGALLVCEGMPNRQRSMGADVMTRIEYSLKNGQEPLQRAVIATINDIFRAVEAKHKIPCKNIKSVVVTGNSTMLHLLANRDASGIASAPYEMSDDFGYSIPASSLELLTAPNAELYLAKCPTAFVGGDISTGILALGLHTTDETVLLVDVGTNGEMVLAHNGRLYCCATSAGPAFEGANIEFGMSASAGAISEVSELQGHLLVGVIGGGKPLGICGSGLLDAIKVGLDIEAIDETGLLIGDDGYYLDFDSGIQITQRDVREVQLAKSAVCAGILTLVEHAGISLERIDRMYLAGGFGSRLNPLSAVDIGMFPRPLLNKLLTVGNVALKGAGELLLNPSNRSALNKICEMCEYLELSDSEYFSNEFVNNMMF